MALSPGTRLGAFEIVASIGAGGMGEVYRARDSKLHRDVALKILPEAFTADADRLARFKREAQVLASLNHTNIAGIYGFEDSGVTHALVMEFVDGEDLAQRIARGPIAIDEALPIAKQIAEALEAAHEQGIVHRDLKPANIKVRPDGTVKVLDFGLAKAMDQPPSSGLQASGTASISPTITSPALMTGAGMILGTAAYMAPEQARGKAVDKRADIWAFGCVLYEMLTAKRVFTGDEVTDVIVSVMSKEPDWAALPAALPPGVTRLLKRCFEKDVRRRLQAIGEARIALDDARHDKVDELASNKSASAMRPMALAALAAAIATATAAWLVMRNAVPPLSPSATRFAWVLPSDQELTGVSLMDLSPDGRQIVYTAANKLYRRRLDQLTGTPIDGTEGVAAADVPAFSPDGRSVVFATGTGTSVQIKKVPIEGGAVTKLCDLSTLVTGLRWAGDRILFTQGALAPQGIYAMPDSGGQPQRIVTADAGETISSVDVLPDGDTLVATSRLPGSRGNIVAFSVKTGSRHVVLKDAGVARVGAAGQLVYSRDGTLYHQAFDARTKDVVGDSTPIATNLTTRSSYGYAASFAVSAAGTLAYAPSSTQTRRFEWVDRKDAREQPIPIEPMAYIYPTIAPDGSRIALNVHDDAYSIWMWNIASSTLSRLTLEQQDVRYALWTPDSKRVIYSLQTASGRQLMWIPADGGGSSEAISPRAENQYPVAVAPDGKALVFRHGPTGGFAFALQSLQGERSMAPVTAAPGVVNGEISPDGRWLAYQAGANFNASDVYVQPFPSGGGRWIVSTHGGSRPLWARNGRELFYLTLDGHIAAVPITPGPTFTFGRAEDVLDVRRFITNFPAGVADPGRTYDVSLDGQRFLLMAPANDTQRQIVVVEHWLDELRSNGSPRTNP